MGFLWCAMGNGIDRCYFENFLYWQIQFSVYVNVRVYGMDNRFQDWFGKIHFARTCLLALGLGWLGLYPWNPLLHIGLSDETCPFHMAPLCYGRQHLAFHHDGHVYFLVTFISSQSSRNELFLFLSRKEEEMD